MRPWLAVNLLRNPGLDAGRQEVEGDVPSVPPWHRPSTACGKPETFAAAQRRVHRRAPADLGEHLPANHQVRDLRVRAREARRADIRLRAFACPTQLPEQRGVLDTRDATSEGEPGHPQPVEAED